jgi:hypothetical protein
MCINQLAKALNGSSNASAGVGRGSFRSFASGAVVVSFFSRAARDLSEQRLGGIASPFGVPPASSPARRETVSPSGSAPPRCPAQ